MHLRSFANKTYSHMEGTKGLFTPGKKTLISEQIRHATRMSIKPFRDEMMVNLVPTPSLFLELVGLVNVNSLNHFYTGTFYFTKFYRT